MEPILSRNVDFQGRRIINAGNSVGNFDYTTKYEIERQYSFDRFYSKLRDVGLDGFKGELSDPQKSKLTEVTASETPPQTQAGLLFYETDTGLVKYATGVGYTSLNTHMRIDTYANMGTASSYTNQLFAASDRGYLTFVSDGSNWIYICGVHRDTLASIPTPSIDGYLFYSTDYEHIFRRVGASWTWGPGELGSKYIVASVGAAPLGGVWQLCDGTAAVNYATATGGTGSITVPDLTGNTFIKGGTYTGTPRVADRATWEAAAVTDNESTHTHDVDPTSTTSGNNSDSQIVQSGTGVTVAADTHTHDTDIANFASAAGAVHNHALSDANAQLKVFNETNGGLPLSLALDFYMRR
jgi:hypothetical protein